MLSQLDDFAGKIGEPMAIALITTFYGAVAQQLIFKPAAQRTDAKNRVLFNAKPYDDGSIFAARE